jgi:hypothetical protein
MQHLWKRLTRRHHKQPRPKTLNTDTTDRQAAVTIVSNDLFDAKLSRKTVAFSPNTTV